MLWISRKADHNFFDHCETSVIYLKLQRWPSQISIAVKLIGQEFDLVVRLQRGEKFLETVLKIPMGILTQEY